MAATKKNPKPAPGKVGGHRPPRIALAPGLAIDVEYPAKDGKKYSIVCVEVGGKSRYRVAKQDEIHNSLKKARQQIGTLAGMTKESQFPTTDKFSSPRSATAAESKLPKAVADAEKERAKAEKAKAEGKAPEPKANKNDDVAGARKRRSAAQAKATTKDE